MHILLDCDQLIEILTILLKDGYGSAFNGFVNEFTILHSGTRFTAHVVKWTI